MALDEDDRLDARFLARALALEPQDMFFVGPPLPPDPLADLDTTVFPGEEGEDQE